jgi:CubicO group peptidase (beta-lactamase class C family)
VEDLARFDIALDGGSLIGREGRDAMWTRPQGAAGALLPYALGWFVEDHGGRRVVWHYGWYPPTVSAIYVKVPDRRLSFIILANSDGLSAGVAWTQEGVRGSPFARLFLERFASGA